MNSYSVQIVLKRESRFYRFRKSEGPTHIGCLASIVGLIVVSLFVRSIGTSVPNATVEFAADGDPSEANVTYVVGGETREQLVSLPWSIEIEFGSSVEISLLVENPTETGKVTCSINLVGSYPMAVSGEASAKCANEFGRDGSEDRTVETVNR